MRDDLDADHGSQEAEYFSGSANCEWREKESEGLCCHGLLIGSEICGPLAYKRESRDFLYVQWLGLMLHLQGTQVSSLVRELRSRKPYGTAKKFKN